MDNKGKNDIRVSSNSLFLFVIVRGCKVEFMNNLDTVALFLFVIVRGCKESILESRAESN